MRELLGPDALIVTPGVRPAGADAGDQKRVATPAAAVAAAIAMNTARLLYSTDMTTTVTDAIAAIVSNMVNAC